MLVVRKRFNKYDFCSSFIDRFDTPMGVSFMDVIENNISKAISKGKFITILSHHSIASGKFSQIELDIAIEKDVNKNAIIPIYLDEVAKEYFSLKLSGYDYIDLSTKQSFHNDRFDSKDIPSKQGNLINSLARLGNDIVHSLLIRLQGWGNIQTYATNFRVGRGLCKDENEADKLDKLIVEHLEKSSLEQ